jgi:hypothetical protein
MNETQKLLLVIPIKLQDDLAQIVESEGLHTVSDLLRKTGTSYNSHWNGNYVLDQDEIPWKAGADELSQLAKTSGRVIVINNMEYGITENVTLFKDTDGSYYVLEEEVNSLTG